MAGTGSNAEKMKRAKAAYNKKWRDEHREHLREYQKAYREKHPDKIKASQDRFWMKKAEEMENENDSMGQ